MKYRILMLMLAIQLSGCVDSYPTVAIRAVAPESASKHAGAADKSLHVLYLEILSRSNQAARKNLEREQQRWMKKREARARAAADSAQGGPDVENDYMKSFISSTEDRRKELELISRGLKPSLSK